jgi:glycosyltransferase involved in cell wall biosynthesis
MTRLIIQIPCYNEAATLGATLSELPREVPGTSCVQWLVVDDGSTDGTSEVARRLGVDHVVRHARNRGLAQAFRTGIDASLRLGADIIVNTDADNQYRGTEIPRLIQPILEGRADVVIGDRRTQDLEHFSPMKKILQRFGSFVVRSLSDTDVPDAVSGFRAISRRAAMELNIVSSFSYTIEMIIQAGKKRLAVVSVPVSVNPRTRESRLFRSLRQFVTLSAATMIRTYTMYQPLRVFTSIGLLLALVGAAPVLRFLYFFLAGEGAGHVQSLVLGGVLMVVGLMTVLIGVVADLIAANRRLLEMILERQRISTEPGGQARERGSETSATDDVIVNLRGGDPDGQPPPEP